MKRFTLEQKIFYTMSFIGGGIGGFALLRTGVLGSAQTSNLAEMTLNLLGGDFYHVSLRIVAMLLYGLGVALTRIIPKRTHMNIKTVSAVLNVPCLLIMGLLPQSVNGVIALWPVFFMAALQWNSFPGGRGFVSSCVFSTNNYRQVVIGLTDYALTREQKSLDRAFFFTGTLLSFHLGVTLAWLAIRFYGFRGILVFILPTLIVLPFIRKERRLNEQSA